MPPVWWFAVANVATAIVVWFGLHAALSRLTGVWWIHVIGAPVLFGAAFFGVHHGLSFVVNAAVERVHRRVKVAQSASSPALGRVGPMGVMAEWATVDSAFRATVVRCERPRPRRRDTRIAGSESYAWSERVSGGLLMKGVSDRWILR